MQGDPLQTPMSMDQSFGEFFLEKKLLLLPLSLTVRKRIQQKPIPQKQALQKAHLEELQLSEA